MKIIAQSIDRAVCWIKYCIFIPSHRMWITLNWMCCLI